MASNSYATRGKRRIHSAKDYVFQAWPAMFYGPDGQSAAFEGPLDVPEGWHDNPAKVGVKGAKTVIPGLEEAEAAQGNDTDENEKGAPAAVPEYDDITAAQIVERLTAKKATFNETWGKQRLYDLLVEVTEA